eukprot:6083930-Prymnesium_polylepis.1
MRSISDRVMPFNAERSDSVLSSRSAPTQPDGSPASGTVGADPVGSGGVTAESTAMVGLRS